MNDEVVKILVCKLCDMNLHGAGNLFCSYGTCGQDGTYEAERPADTMYYRLVRRTEEEVGREEYKR